MTSNGQKGYLEFLSVSGETLYRLSFRKAGPGLFEIPVWRHNSRPSGTRVVIIRTFDGKESGAFRVLSNVESFKPEGGTDLNGQDGVLRKMPADEDTLHILCAHHGPESIPITQSILDVGTITVTPDKPNIVLILADDMGYSDLSSFGAEIQTPNLDKLANNGLVMTQFYNAGRCCPSRASILTGLYQHQAGIGEMDGNKGIPSYQGYLNTSCVTLAEALKPGGYSTYAVGKWHVGTRESVRPYNRGFDRFYGSPMGGGIYFSPFSYISNRPLYLDNTIVEPDSDFYSTDAFTDYAVTFIDEHEDPGKPFFMYIAYIAPHYPLQAHAEDIELYRDTYRNGFAQYRQARMNRMKELGIVSDDLDLSPPDGGVNNWEDLGTQSQDKYDLRMAAYAAMMTAMDRGIGRIAEALEQKGVLDNTLFLYLSDNGGCDQTLGNNNSDSIPIGSPGSWSSYRRSWANVSNTPFRLYKKWVHEGGISTPLIVHFPRMIKERAIDSQVGHIIDFMPTFLELAGVQYPESYNGQAITPMEGKSLVPVFRGNIRESHDVLYWEHLGHKAVRTGDWKLVRQYQKDWELYNIRNDRTELNDLSVENPDRAEEMEAQYIDWAQRVGATLKWDL